MSYSREQLYLAEALVRRLQDRGFEIWFDLQKLTPGVNWTDGIKQGVREADALVLLASRTALESPYVRNEWEQAIADGKPVYVVLVDYVRLPLELESTPRISLQRNLDGVVKALEQAMMGKPFRDRVPVPFLPSTPHARLLLLHLLLLAIAVGAFGYAVSQPAIVPWLNTIYRIFIPFPDLRQTFAILFLVFGGFIAYIGVQYALQRAVTFTLLIVLLSGTGLLSLLLGSVTLWFALFLNAGFAPLIVALFAITIGIGSLVMLRRLRSLQSDARLWLPRGGLNPQARLTFSNRFSRSYGLAAQPRREFVLQFARRDEALARYIREVLKKAGCVEHHEITSGRMLVSILTANIRLRDVEDSIAKAGLFIPILAGAPPAEVLDCIKHYQIFDYRLGDERKLRALGLYLAMPNVVTARDMGSAVTPLDFDRTSLFMRYEAVRRRDGRFARWELNLLGLMLPGLLLILICPFCLALPSLFQPSYAISRVQAQQTQAAERQAFEVYHPTLTAELTSSPPTRLPTLLPSATPRPVRMAELDFELPREWELETNYTALPFDDLRGQHPRGEPLWAAHTENLWVLALRYPDSANIVGYTSTRGIYTLPTSVPIGFMITGNYVALGQRELLELASVREWVFFIEHQENVAVLHVMVNGSLALSDTPPEIVLDFVRSPGF